jgi:hypothetical protein
MIVDPVRHYSDRDLAAGFAAITVLGLSAVQGKSLLNDYGMRSSEIIMSESQPFICRWSPGFRLAVTMSAASQ